MADDLTYARGKKLARERYPEPAHGPASRIADIARNAFVDGFVVHAESLEAQYIAAAEQLTRAAGPGVSPREAYDLLAKSGMADAVDQLRKAQKRIAELEAQLEGKNDG